MKLGASYNLYDGWDMLEHSIRTIRPSLDYVNVICQRTSNQGQVLTDQEWNECSTLLRKLHKENLIDSIIQVEPNLDKDAWHTEINKRQMGYADCAENNCTHYMTIDADEFYKVHQLDHAKQHIEAHDYDTTLCHLIDFYGDYEHREPNISQTLVPLIYKITPNRVFNHNALNRPNTDPTRQLAPGGKQHMFPSDLIVMYHMTMVRRDANAIRQKLDNSSARGNFGDNSFIDGMIDFWDNWKNTDKSKGIHIVSDPSKPFGKRLQEYPLVYENTDFIIKG